MNKYKTLSAYRRHLAEVKRANRHGENLVYCAGLGTALDYAVKEVDEKEEEKNESE